MNDSRALNMRETPTVFVYKTSVRGEEEVNRLRPALNRLMPGSGEWNFDLEDCDRILRVETSCLNEKAIRKLLLSYGFDCEELPDEVPVPLRQAHFGK